MNRTGKIAIILFGAAVLICCASLIRDGLRSIAKEIRDKPWPRMPDTLTIRELTVRQATLWGPTDSSNHYRIAIENMSMKVGTNEMTTRDLKIDAQPSDKKQK
jgi:hypothetical protein